MEFTVCVADAEKVLQALSEALIIRYRAGTFSLFEDVFVESGRNEDFFSLSSNGINVSVHLEKYEGYFNTTVSGEGMKFRRAKEHLILNSC